MKTVSDVMADVFKGQGFKCLLHEKRNVDADGPSEYADGDLRIRGKLFEHPRNDRITKVDATPLDPTTPTPLTYFMDGSRRVFRFSDVILGDGRYYPVLAGQVGVAVLQRDSGSMRPLRDYVAYHNLLVLPDTIDRADRDAMRQALKSGMKREFIVEDYQTGVSGGNGAADYINAGTKKILDKMHDLELNAVKRMMDDRVLRHDAMLVIDGSLQFRREVLTRNDFPTRQLRNVIGISKSFAPSQPVAGMTGGKHLGTILQQVEFGQRTPVFKAGEDAFKDILGVWYLRIRQRRQLTSPLQGVIKIEVLADGNDEEENGLASDRVDTLSAYILSERSVTPYGSDERWANHLYPVFLTESYLKSGFLSDVCFMGLL